MLGTWVHTTLPKSHPHPHPGAGPPSSHKNKNKTKKPPHPWMQTSTQWHPTCLECTATWACRAPVWPPLHRSDPRQGHMYRCSRGLRGQPTPRTSPLGRGHTSRRCHQAQRCRAGRGRRSCWWRPPGTRSLVLPRTARTQLRWGTHLHCSYQVGTVTGSWLRGPGTSPLNWTRTGQ